MQLKAMHGGKLIALIAFIRNEGKKEKKNQK